MTEAEQPADELTSRLKRRRSSAARRLSVISLSEISSAWRRKSSFFGSKYTLGAEAPVQEVRDRVLFLIGDGSEFDPRDVNKVHNNKWFIQRFVLDRLQNTYADRDDLIEDSARAVVECMRWRKSEGINDLKSSDFPREFFSSNTSMISTDHQGNPLIFTRAKYHTKINEWHELIKMKESFLYETMDQKLDGRSVGIILDLEGCGIRNFDLDYTMFMFELFSRYYPMTCSFLYVNEVSWIMRPGISLLMKIVPKKYQKQVKFTTKKQLHQLVGKEYLPFYLGGTAAMEVVVPSDCPSLDEVAERHGISKEALEQQRKQLQAAERGD
jgi:hypothetical protein